MDFMTLLRLVPVVVTVIDTVRSGLTNDAIAGSLKTLLPANLLGDIQKYAEIAFNLVKPALQVVAAVQTSIDPNRNKTIQNLLNVANEKMGLGLVPLVVDGDYGPKTKEMALAVQRKLGGDVVADGWIGQMSLAALQGFMQK